MTANLSQRDSRKRFILENLQSFVKFMTPEHTCTFEGMTVSRVEINDSECFVQDESLNKYYLIEDGTDDLAEMKISEIKEFFEATFAVHKKIEWMIK